MTWASEMVYSGQLPGQERFLPGDSTEDKAGFGSVGTKCANG